MNRLFLITFLFFYIIFYSINLYASNEFLNDSSDTFLLAPFQNNDLLLITGFDYSSGSYGLEHDTYMLYIPMLLRYQKNNWGIDLTFSYIRMTGPDGVYASGDGGVIPTESDGISVNNSSQSADSRKMKPQKKGNISTNEGLGDVLLNVNYALDVPLQFPFLFELGGQIKIPVADEDKALGTGEFDFYVYFDLAYNIGSFSPFMTLGYQFLGDPDYVNLDNVYYTSLGMDYALSSTLHSGIIYDYKEKVLSDSYDKSEAMVYLNWSLTKDVSVNTYVVGGFSKGSPDWASGLQFSFSF